MKTSDIADETVLSIIRGINATRHPPIVIGGQRLEFGPRPAMIWDLEEKLPGIPPKLVLSKCRNLIRRGLVEGCGCGCRGDFKVLDA